MYNNYASAIDIARNIAWFFIKLHTQILRLKSKTWLDLKLAFFGNDKSNGCLIESQLIMKTICNTTKSSFTIIKIFKNAFEWRKSWRRPNIELKLYKNLLQPEKVFLNF